MCDGALVVVWFRVLCACCAVLVFCLLVLVLKVYVAVCRSVMCAGMCCVWMCANTLRDDRFVGVGQAKTVNRVVISKVKAFVNWFCLFLYFLGWVF